MNDSSTSTQKLVKLDFNSFKSSQNNPTQQSSADSIRFYLQEIGRVPLLEKEEEVSEAQKIQTYNQIVEDRNQSAQAGNITLQEFNQLIEVRDRLAIQLSHRPSLKRWSQELGIDISTLKDNLAKGKQAWAEVVGFEVSELEKIEGNAVKAKKHMIEANLRLVVSVAKKYQDRGLELLDLIQEGTIGLERAVEKFDTTKGYRFSTYAYWWIRQGVTRAIATQARTIRLPVHITEKLNKIKKAQRQLSQKMGHTPQVADIAKETNMTEEQVRQALQDIPKSFSLDIKVGKNQDTELSDLLETDNESPEENLIKESLQKDLADLIAQLNAKERIVIRMRFGFDGEQPSSLAEIGRALELSRERVRQIQAKAILKLRQPRYRRVIKDYLSALN